MWDPLRFMLITVGALSHNPILYFKVVAPIEFSKHTMRLSGELVWWELQVQLGGNAQYVSGMWGEP